MNKKGFTLIEIIISIAIISLIAVIGIVAIKKSEKTDEEKQEKYIENIKLQTAVYIETEKTNTKIQTLKDPGDFIYIQLKDLIGLGLLKEETINPFYENVTTKEKDYDLVKVFINTDGNIDIMYPTIYKGKKKEEIDNIKNNAQIHIKNNLPELNKVNLPSTKNVLNQIKNNSNNITELKNNFLTLKNNGYNDSYYEEAGYYLSDYEGNEIPTIESDWCISKTWDNDNKYWTYTYSICSSSDLWKRYKNIEHNNEKRNITFVDKDAPIIIEINDFHEYGTKTNDILYSYYNTTTLECNYTKYESKNGIGSSNYNDYYLFDNKDGTSNTFKNYINLSKTNENIKIKDTNNNERSYRIVKNAIDNTKPTITYSTPSVGYYLTSDLKYDKNKDIQPIKNNISVSDDIDTSFTIEYELRYAYNSVLSTNIIYKKDSKEIPVFGRYNLYIKACDSFNLCDEKTLAIVIKKESTQKVTASSTICDDTCIIEKMHDNSKEWARINKAQKEYKEGSKKYKEYESQKSSLHDENEIFKEEITFKNNVYYSGGAWCERIAIDNVNTLYSRINVIDNGAYDDCLVGQMKANSEQWSKYNVEKKKYTKGTTNYNYYKKLQDDLAAANETLSQEFKTYTVYKENGRWYQTSTGYPIY